MAFIWRGQSGRHKQDWYWKIDTEFFFVILLGNSFYNPYPPEV